MKLKEKRQSIESNVLLQIMGGKQAQPGDGRGLLTCCVMQQRLSHSFSNIGLIVLVHPYFLMLFHGSFSCRKHEQSIPIFIPHSYHARVPAFLYIDIHCSDRYTHTYWVCNITITKWQTFLELKQTNPKNCEDE